MPKVKLPMRWYGADNPPDLSGLYLAYITDPAFPEFKTLWYNNRQGTWHENEDGSGEVVKISMWMQISHPYKQVIFSVPDLSDVLEELLEYRESHALFRDRYNTLLESIKEHDPEFLTRFFLELRDE
jgi:hypothetical protein